MHRSQIVENPFCFAGYLELRYAIGVVEDLDVRPGYLAAPAGFEGLQERFLGGKTARVGLGRGGPFAFAVFAFAGGENSLSETRCSGDGFADAINFNDVGAYRKYHGRVRTTCGSGWFNF